MTAIGTFFSPAQRWRELATVAETMQSNILIFRTRTRPFVISMVEPRQPEQELMRRIQDSEASVTHSGSLSKSSFTGMHSDKVWTVEARRTGRTQDLNLPPSIGPR